MLNGSLPDVFNLEPNKRGATARWASLCTKASIALACGGVLIGIMAVTLAFGTPKATGGFLGLLLLAAGGAGLLGAQKRNSNVVTGSTVACFVGLLLAFHFSIEVTRSTQVDCALAELYVRSLHTESLLKDQMHHNIFNSIYSRINEVEEMMDQAQSGAVQLMHLKNKQDELRMQDQQYIQAKLEELRAHASQVREAILNNPNITEHAQHLAEETREDLIRRITAAEKVLQSTAKHVVDGVVTVHELTYEEFEEVLNALTDAHAAPLAPHLQVAGHDDLSGALKQAVEELPSVKGSLERMKSNTYHTLNVDGAGDTLNAYMEEREKKQKAWYEKFSQQLEERQKKHETGPDWLETMPGHCMSEESREVYLVAAAFGTVVLQLAAIYIYLSLLFRMPVKGD